MITAEDVEVLERAARTELTIKPREKRWTHLSLCALDAVFSINAKYSRVVHVCYRYALHASLPNPLMPAAKSNMVVGTVKEQRLDDFAQHVRMVGAQRFAAEVIANRGLTSTRGGILKAEAALWYAMFLVKHGVQTIGDVAELLGDDAHLGGVEADLAMVRGHGSGARLSYLWMLAGDDQHVKPDRMVLRWIALHLGPVNVDEAREIVMLTAERLGCTPWELDHAIWRAKPRRPMHG
ncbi:hypothetical protein [Kutzneria sp. CA-103260]|uniref:hypothetical protein n=1 Tax=Kutzneria sp. CA-103260 TaxID=2802641 RepID=UPI001BAAD80A|nr:hypothetical protein [Kutzneria sp. CA-103260]QUQ64460.1 heme peroxidase superfamily protein [Kutzneria sp. CA-103260]